MATDPLTKMLADPERRPLLGALPVVTVRPDDDADYRTAVKKFEATRIDLERRAREHGTIVELLRPDLVRKLETAQTQRAWKAADPFVLRGASTPTSSTAAALPEAWASAEDEGHAFVAWARGRTPEEMSRADRFVDRERDVAKLEHPRGWAKLGRLSLAEGDASRRLSFGLGQEVQDDDHPDLARHADLFGWASEVVPDLATVWSDGLRKKLGAASGRKLIATNPIVYWNRPNGGALFHHDALPGYIPKGLETEGGDPPVSGQRGVAYVQGCGRTVWLALSIESLAQRCCEFMQDVVDGSAPWLFDGWVKQEVWQPLFFATREVEICMRALALEDAGALRPLVHGCLEFTGFLIDSGHAAVLHPGDVIALPNHGEARTAMHSVYCGSSGPNVGFSLGLRGR